MKIDVESISMRWHRLRRSELFPLGNVNQYSRRVPAGKDQDLPASSAQIPIFWPGKISMEIL